MSYRIQYLRSFQRDFDEITTYITHNLGAPNAARELSDNLFKNIDRLADFPYSCKLCILSRPLPIEYRMFTVKNYAVFYSVDEEIKAVRFYRMLYGRRDFERLL